MKKNKTLKRFLAFLLCAAMMVTYMPSSVYTLADDSVEATSASEPATAAPAPETKAEPVQDQEETKSDAPETPVVENNDPTPEVQEEESPVVPEEETVVDESAASENDTRAGPDAEEESVEDADAKEEKDENKLNEETLVFTGNANSVNVKVVAVPGTFPKGTTMKVTSVAKSEVRDAVESALDEVNDFRAVDITFYVDGNEVQPEKPVNVKLSTSAFDNNEGLNVVHVEDPDANIAEVMDLTKSSDSMAQFKTDGFSIYAVVPDGDTGNNARATVIFKSGDKERATVYVKNADTLDELKDIIYDPGVGELAAGKTFRGWVVSKDAEASYTTTTDAMNIEAVRDYFEKLNITEGDTYYVHAVILDAYTVTYKSDDGTIIDTITVLGVDGSTEDFEINMVFEPENPDIQQFQGWYVSGAATDESGKPIPATEAKPVGTKLKINGDVTLSAKAPKGQYLIFKENGKGASYTVSQFLESNQVTVEPSDPTRLGYTFDGWYTEAPSEEGGDPSGSKFTFGQTISEKTYLYAKWKENEKANYAVIIWKQSVNDKKDAADSAKTYDFGESVTIEGNVGETVNTVTASGSGDDRYATVNGSAKRYPGFHLNKYDTNVTIDSKGNTVVNVYYDRNLVTLTFRYRSGGSWETQATMTGLYGQTLASQGYTWPTNRWWYDSYSTYGGYSGSGTRTTFLDAFKLSDDSSSQTFYGFNGNGNNHVYFYKQDADGNYPNTATNTVETGNGTFNISDKYNGYKAVEYSTNGYSWTALGEKNAQGYYASVGNYSSLYIHYAPLKYNILYKDGIYVNGDGAVLEDMDNRGQLHVDENIAMDSNVASYNKGGANYYEPTFAGFVFEGWYADDSCTQPYTFTTMSEGITVYAKWRQVEYRVFLHPNADHDESFKMGDQKTSFRVKYGAQVGLSPATRDDYELMGWYYDEGCTRIFSAEAYPLNESTPGLAAYDKTRPTETDMWGEPESSENKDAERFWITKSLDLYAKWRSTIDGAKGINVVYDANGGSNAPTDSLLYKDQTNAVAQGASTPASTDEQFVYWVVQKWNETTSKFEDTNVFVYPGDTFQVLKANAKVEDITPDPSTPDVTKKYTVQLRAEYTPKETPKPTHIYWYKNDGTDAFQKDDDLQINQKVSIEQPPARPGYVFKGWARIPIGNNYDAAKAWEGNSDNWTQPDAETYLFYAADGTFHTGSESGPVATHVAADEKTPYHAMFALWNEEVTAKIVGTEKSETYNGQNQTNDEYKVEYYVAGEKVDNLPNGVTFTPGTVTPATGKDVGPYSATVTGTLTSNNAKYVIPENAVTDGTLKLTITPRPVTLTSANGEKVYDGTPLTKNAQTDVTVGGDGFVSGEGATYNITGTQTEVGSSPNAFTYTLNSNTKAANYTITTTPGTLTVTALTDKVTVTITENSGSEKYDGTAKTVTGYTVTDISNDLYTENDFSFTGDASHKTVSGTDAGSYNMGLLPADFTNNNTNFTNVEFVIVDGTLNIAPRTVTLTSASGSKTYDGTPLTKNAQTDVTVGGEGFVEGEGATYNITGTQTDVGSSANKFEYTLNEGTKAANYTITKTEGTLTVTADASEVVVNIKENSGSEKYDGTEKTVTGYTVTDISSDLYTENDFSFTGDASHKTVSGTDAGSYDMGLLPADFTNNNKNFTNVKFVIEDGTLEISKRTVTLTSADGEKVYDGTPLTKNAQTDVTVGGDGFASGEGAKYNITGSQTNVGTSSNSFTYTLNEGTKADNYTITTNFGDLEVTPVTDKVTVTITENSGSEKYDGTEKTVTGYTVSIDNDLYTEADFTFSGTDTVKGTDAGSYEMELTPEDFTNISDNFTNVEFVIVDGTLEISKRTVTLTSADGEKVYDGTPLTKNAQTDVTVGGDGFASGEGATYDITGTQTEVGSSANKFDYTLKEGTKASNYTITKTEGTLKVTAFTDKVTVTITENSGSEKYDGTEKTVTGYTVSISNPLYTEDDFEFSGNDTVKGTDAGTYDMDLKPADFENINTNFKNVEFVIVDGTLEISKRTVTLTSADGEKVYDGTPLTKNAQTDVTVGGDGFASGEGATYDITGSQTEVGSSANKFEYALKEGTKASNYTITKTEGTLKVTALTDKVTVTITENSGEAKYDGEEKTVTGYTVSIDNKLYTENDFTFNGDATIKGTDAGSYPMELKPEDFENTSKNFSNVEFKIVDGTLEIAKRTVTMTSATDSKTYDGTPLTNDEVKETGDGFVKGEGATYNVTGTQTEAGTSNNTFTYKLNNNTKAGNYEITQVEGTLTVNADEKTVTVVITENSGKEKYDGTEKTVKGYEVTSISSNLYKESDFTFSGDDTAKGTDAGSYDMELKPTDFTNTNKNFKNVEFTIVDGTLEISKRTVTLTSADDEKVYDGTALTNDTVTVGGDGFAEGEGATYDVTGTQLNVGSSPNSFEYKLNEGTKADNYEITQTVGTLKVTPVTDKVTVTITGHKKTEDYTGEEQSVSGYDVSIDNELYKESDFEFTGKDEVKATDVKRNGDDVDSYPMGLKKDDFKNISENFTNVEFVVTDGSLTIKPLKVKIESASAEKTYDGKPLTKHEVTVDGFVEGEGLSEIKVTGSQTYVGESPNAFQYKLFGDNVFRRLMKAITVTDTDAYDPAANGVTKTTKAGNYDITKVEGTLKVTDENVDIDDVATKTHEDKEYKLGETVKFTIEVTNIYDAVKTITVTEQEGVKITSDSVFEGVKPGEKVTVTAEYVVTEEDLIAGEFNNKATVKFSDVDKPYEPEDKVDVEDPKSHLTIDKKTTSEPANGETYALGEKITYEVKATNDGNMTLKNIEIKDDLTGDTWTVEKLAPGESETFTAEYTVTEADIIAGSVKNEATGTAEPENPDAPEPEVVPGTTEDPTDESNPHLTITKTTTNKPKNGKKYTVGETITYKITVLNDGNLTVKNIEVNDDLTGDSWTVDSLKPGESMSFDTQYKVTEKDAKNGSVTNNATATGDTDDPDNPHPDVDPGTKTVPIETPAKKSDKPDTGDHTGLMGMMGLFGASVAGLFAMFFRRRREQE